MSNSLAEVHPELVSEWSEKNLPLTPDDITFGSNKKVWWKGACGHEWKTSVSPIAGWICDYVKKKKLIVMLDFTSGIILSLFFLLSNKVIAICIILFILHLWYQIC